MASARPIFLAVLLFAVSWAGCARQPGLAGEPEEGLPVRLASDALPTPRWGMGTVWTGVSTVMAGGQAGSHFQDTFEQQFDTIAVHRPNGETVTTAEEQLRDRMRSMAGVWTGEAVYFFGGKSRDQGVLDQILRYDPDSGKLTTLDATLSSPRERSNAVWTGQHAYIFGGLATDEIVRYTPETQTTQTMEAELPSDRWEMGAVWTGEAVYLFGGETPEGSLGDILRYDPSTDSIRTVDTNLSPNRSGARAVWTGDSVFVFGGVQNHSGLQKTDAILRFDPDSSTVRRMDGSLPSPRHLTEAVWTGDAAFIYGGLDGEGQSLDQIVKYIPSLDSPAS